MNIQMTFAQHEREIASSRTRDKIAATRKKGMFTGGRPVLGYDLDRRPGGTYMVVNAPEANRVRAIFRLYLASGSLSRACKTLNERGWTNKAWTG